MKITAAQNSFWLALVMVLLGSSPLLAAQLSSISTTNIKFTASDDEATLIAKGAARVTFGNTSIYIGTQQVTSINQNPIMTSFTNGIRDWVRTDYETTGADGRGRGLLWDGANNLYAVFTTDGTQGTPSQDFRRFTGSGWLTSYGSGGGPVASVLVKIDPLTGAGIAGNGTFIRAQLSSGNTNTLVPTGLEFSNNNVVFYGDSFFSPLRVNKTRMVQTTSGSSPFDYRIVFDPTLKTALSAEAIGWDNVAAFSPLASSSIPVLASSSIPVLASSSIPAVASQSIPESNSSVMMFVLGGWFGLGFWRKSQNKS